MLQKWSFLVSLPYSLLLYVFISSENKNTLERDLDICTSLGPSHLSLGPKLGLLDAAHHASQLSQSCLQVQHQKCQYIV